MPSGPPPDTNVPAFSLQRSLTQPLKPAGLDTAARRSVYGVQFDAEMVCFESLLLQ